MAPPHLRHRVSNTERQTQGPVGMGFAPRGPEGIETLQRPPGQGRDRLGQYFQPGFNRPQGARPGVHRDDLINEPGTGRIFEGRPELGTGSIGEGSYWNVGYEPGTENYPWRTEMLRWLGDPSLVEPDVIDDELENTEDQIAKIYRSGDEGMQYDSWGGWGSTVLSDEANAINQALQFARDPEAKSMQGFSPSTLRGALGNELYKRNPEMYRNMLPRNILNQLPADAFETQDDWLNQQPITVI